MHNETSDPNPVHCITYIKKDTKKALRWNLGDASLEYSKWKYFTLKHVIQCKSIIMMALATHLIMSLELIFILVIWAESTSNYFAVWELNDLLESVQNNQEMLQWALHVPHSTASCEGII